MNKKIIGKNAGIVWQTLHNNTLSWEELLKQTKLSPVELAYAIGWMAREDKITFYQRNGIAFFGIFHETYY